MKVLASRLAAVVRGGTKRRAILAGAAALIVLAGGTAASAAVTHRMNEQQRTELLAEVTASAIALDAQLASVGEAGVQYESEVAAADELAAELSALLALPPERFDATARTGVETALAELEEAASPLPEADDETVTVRDEATIDELRATETALVDASEELAIRADDVETRQVELAGATETARSAAKALVDGVVAATDGLLAANSAASVESSDRVRTVVAALGTSWTSDGLRAWIDAIVALEASSAEAAARLVAEQSQGTGGGTGTGTTRGTAGGQSTTGSSTLFPPNWGSLPPSEFKPLPGPTYVPDIWPVIWNEHWRPYEECVGHMGLVMSFPTNENFGSGFDTGMTTPWTHSWGAYDIGIYTCGY